jgi:hypothetical protein
MKLKQIFAIAVVAAFASPLALAGGGNKASSGASGGASSDGGAEAMFKALDKNKDGAITREEAKGTPHDKDFAKLDKNNDGKLTAAEHAAAPEHAKAKSGASSGGSTKY